MKILLVEDDFDLSGALMRALTRRGMEVITSGDGLTALGLAPNSGLTWASAIALLVVAVRVALLPLVAHGIRAARAASVTTLNSSRSARALRLPASPLASPRLAT